MTISIIWYPILFCLYLCSPISLRKLFVLITYLWMSTFIWKLCRLIVVGEIKQKLHITLMLRFFGTPCTWYLTLSIWFCVFDTLYLILYIWYLRVQVFFPSRFPQRWYIGVASGFQRCLKVVSQVIQWIFKSVSLSF